MPPGGSTHNILQRTHPSHVEKETQTTQSDTVGEGKRETAQEQAPTQQRQISRDLILQVTYKPARQTGFPGAEAIYFVVDGQEGVRLSDALEDKWTGFKGRDDRSLFESGRLQIIMRLHVSHLRVLHHRCLIFSSSPKDARLGRTRQGLLASPCVPLILRTS